MFQELVEFKEEHKHCRVPVIDKYQKLGKWVGEQKTAQKQGRLKEERYKRLKEIGVFFNLRSKGTEKGLVEIVRKTV